MFVFKWLGVKHEANRTVEFLLNADSASLSASKLTSALWDQSNKTPATPSLYKGRVLRFLACWHSYNGCDYFMLRSLTWQKDGEKPLSWCPMLTNMQRWCSTRWPITCASLKCWHTQTDMTLSATTIPYRQRKSVNLCALWKEMHGLTRQFCYWQFKFFPTAISYFQQCSYDSPHCLFWLTGGSSGAYWAQCSQSIKSKLLLTVSLFLFPCRHPFSYVAMLCSLLCSHAPHNIHTTSIHYLPHWSPNSMFVMYLINLSLLHKWLDCSASENSVSLLCHSLTGQVVNISNHLVVSIVISMQYYRASLKTQWNDLKPFQYHYFKWVSCRALKIKTIM